MYAIVSTGGKQYRVERGQSLLVERLPVEDGGEATLRPLLFVDGDNVVDGDDLAKVTVQARVVGHERGPKLRVVKFKPKRGYKRRTGHRQELTRIEVTEIKLASRRPSSRGTPKPVAADQAGSGAEAAASTEAAKPERAAAKPERAAAKPARTRGEADAEAKPARRRSSAGAGGEGQAKPTRRRSSAEAGAAEAGATTDAEAEAKPARTRGEKSAPEPKNTASEPKDTPTEPKHTAPEPKNTPSDTEEEGNGA